MFAREVSEAEKFWIEMSIEDRTKFLKSRNLWEGVNTYFWQYLPSEIKQQVEEELEKSRR